MSIASPEIRKIAVEAHLSGKATQQQLADILGFYGAAVVRWVREYRKDGKRTYAALEKGIASALDMVCASDAQKWFKNCGYELFQA